MNGDPHPPRCQVGATVTWSAALDAVISIAESDRYDGEHFSTFDADKPEQAARIVRHKLHIAEQADKRKKI